jgi:hypothetical protein
MKRCCLERFAGFAAALVIIVESSSIPAGLATEPPLHRISSWFRSAARFGGADALLFQNGPKSFARAAEAIDSSHFDCRLSATPALSDEFHLGTAPGRGKSQTLWEANRSPF